MSYIRDIVNMVDRMSVDAAAHPECEVNTLMTTNHTAVQVRNSGQG